MKQHQIPFVQALIVVVGVLFLSSCNGEKIDSDLIDSITGKVSVDKITIDQEDFEMTEGESTVLTATVLPDDATDKTVSWNSSKEDVVMISNTGKAMAIAPGKSIITAKAGSKTDFITITVIANAVPVTGISLDKTTLELKVGDSETLTATVTPPDATNKNVSWTSSDPTIATVENGRVTGVKPGSVTITAKTEDGGMTAECAVTVKTNLAPSVTVGAEHISAVSVVLKGEANLDAQMSSDMTMGIMWSENSGVLPSNSTKIEAKNIEAKEGSTTSYCYSVNLTGLDPEKTYCFRSYVTQNSQDTYGETMSFTTKELSSMLHTEDASNISAVSAILNATYDLTDVQYTNKTIGIYYGTSAETMSETFVAEPSSPKGSISENWTLLDPEQTYYCQSYIILDGKEYKESVKSFTTKPISSMIHTEDASKISAVSAAINASYDLTNIQYTNKTIGIYYGTSSKSLLNTYVAEISSTTGTIAEN
ncbi:MAG: Ig-like domain-containing protein [Bacteroidales bacterium]|nr:Ig-like domain-containing protein [Bacteroidales bacterium]